MKKIFLILFLLPLNLFAQIKHRYQQNESLTYEEVFSAYRYLSENYPDRCALYSFGTGDNGRDIHTFVIEPNGKSSSPATILINNGIHAGEPDGIDASIEFAEKILKNELKYPNTRIVIIPAYNVDGTSIQSCCTRANQNGPLNQGFRANSRNLDLNRDFIKADARNTRTFYEIFQKFQPHVFIDNHVSNGADYQYTMTLISSQADKLGPVLGPFLRNEFEPHLYKEMAEKGTPLVPYVNTIKETPDSGLVGFLETPRFATGYAALFHCIGFVPETHMLKPFPNRVVATRMLMESMAGYVDANASRFVGLKKQAIAADRKRQYFPVNWKLDLSKKNKLVFNGYTAGYKPSEVSGLPRLYYNRNAPYSRAIPNYDRYIGIDTVKKPSYYLIPQGWREVVNRLLANNVIMKPLERDSLITVSATYIKSYKSREQPYEGHYLHSGTTVESQKISKQFFKGDYIISTDQPAVRFLIETLSPQAADSYFNWNFFDSMLQQKEYFSDYVFEDTAAELLKNDPELKRKLEEKRATDPKFKANGAAQLNFIYENSRYHENTFMQYPVYQLP